MGKYEHARIQALLAMWFGRHETSWSAMVVTEQRVRVSATRIRIPAVALIQYGPHPDVLTDPPILVVKILSPNDTYSDTAERAADYLAMGIKAVWIIDPKNRTGRMCVGEAWMKPPTRTKQSCMSNLLRAGRRAGPGRKTQPYAGGAGQGCT